MTNESIRIVFFVVAAAVLISLSSCGGGGGGGSDRMDMPEGSSNDGTPSSDMPAGDSSSMTDTSDTTSNTPTSLTEEQLYGEIDAYRNLANNSPNFGSTTQSSNGNSNDKTTDRVETIMDANGELALTVRDSNGEVSVQLDSRDDLFENLNGTAWMDDTEQDYPQGWSGNGWTLAKQEGNEVVVGFAYTTWEDTDVTNYLAGGYWIKGNEVDGVTEIGAFVDTGPGSIYSYYDDQNASWQNPVTGTATYLGEAEGAYVDSVGDAGIWWSRLMLSANFATNLITGCIGCPAADPSQNDRGIYTYTTLDDLRDDQWTEEDLYISFREGSINNDGSFEGTLKLLELSTNTELDSNGKWGGIFSENTSTSTHPLEAGGTLGGTTTTGIGFTGVFRGQQP